MCLYVRVNESMRRKVNVPQSCFRISFDGVTLPTGDSVIVVLLYYTSDLGVIQSDLISLLPAGKDHSGRAVAEKVASLLKEDLDVSAKVSVPRCGVCGL